MKYINITKPGDIGTTYQLVPETDEERAEMQEYHEWWQEYGCKCTHDTKSYYVADGVNEECQKHHWRCAECHKIVQVG